MIAGYNVTFRAPSAINTSLALRQAIWRKADSRWRICGIPEVFYIRSWQRFHFQTHGTGRRSHKNESGLFHRSKPRGRGRIERFFPHSQTNIFK